MGVPVILRLRGWGRVIRSTSSCSAREWIWAQIGFHLQQQSRPEMATLPRCLALIHQQCEKFRMLDCTARLSPCSTLLIVRHCPMLLVYVSFGLWCWMPFWFCHRVGLFLDRICVLELTVRELCWSNWPQTHRSSCLCLLVPGLKVCPLNPALLLFFEIG